VARLDVDSLSGVIYAVSPDAPAEVGELSRRLFDNPPINEAELARLIERLEELAGTEGSGVVRVRFPSARVRVDNIYRVARIPEFRSDLVESLKRNAVASVKKDGRLYLLIVARDKRRRIGGTDVTDRVVTVDAYAVGGWQGLEHVARIVTYESVYNAVKDMLVEDFKKGDFNLRNLYTTVKIVPAGILGYAEVSREVYSMLREGRIYGRVEVADELGRRVVYHLIVPPRTGGVLYVVQVGDRYYVTEAGGLSDVKPRMVEDFERAEERSMKLPKYRDALEDMELEVLWILENNLIDLPLDLVNLLLERAYARSLLSSLES